MIKTGESLRTTVTLSFDEEPKTVFEIKQLNYSELEDVDKESGVPPQKAFAGTPTVKKKNDNGEEVEVYDFSETDDSDFFAMTSFSTRRDLAIVKSGLCAIDGTQMNPEKTVKWLDSIKPASDATKVIRELSNHIWKFSKEAPKA